MIIFDLCIERWGGNSSRRTRSGNYVSCNYKILSESVTLFLWKVFFSFAERFEWGAKEQQFCTCETSSFNSLKVITQQFFMVNSDRTCSSRNRERQANRVLYNSFSVLTLFCFLQRTIWIHPVFKSRTSRRPLVSDHPFFFIIDLPSELPDSFNPSPFSQTWHPTLRLSH